MGIALIYFLRFAYFFLTCLSKINDGIREKAVDILDIGPGSVERRQILAEGLRQNDVSKDWRVRRWASVVLASVLKDTPHAIMAAGFTEADVQSALDALAENSSVTTTTR